MDRDPRYGVRSSATVCRPDNMYAGDDGDGGEPKQNTRVALAAGLGHIGH